MSLIYYNGEPCTPEAAAADLRRHKVPEVAVRRFLDTAATFGDASHLKAWYVSGEGADKIRWGEEGDFMRCVDIAGKYMDDDQAKGFCNLRHQDALGVPPGGEGKK